MFRNDCERGPEEGGGILPSVYTTPSNAARGKGKRAGPTSDTTSVILRSVDPRATVAEVPQEDKSRACV
jgi:hypothetical protein